MFFKNKKIIKAAKQADVEMLEKCLDMGIDKKVLNKVWREIFKSSNKNSEGCTLYMAKKLIYRGVNVDCTVDSESALIYATLMGFPSVIKYLIEQGADQDIKTKGYRTDKAVDKVRHLSKDLQNEIYLYFKNWHEPCFHQLLHNGDLKDLQRLIEESSDEISMECKTGALRNICCSDNSGSQEDVLKVIELLLTHGVDINSQDGCGDTILSDAGHSGINHAVQFLIEQGADEYIKNNKGKTAYDRANDGSKRYFAEYASIAEDERRENREKENAKKLVDSGSIWLSVDKTQVAHIEDQKPIQQQLREVFNFYTQSVLTVVRNTNTNAESCFEKMFAQYANQDRLAQACDFANKNGQDIDKAAMIKGRIGQKMKIELPK